MEALERVLDGLGWKYKKTGKGYLLSCPFAAQTHKSGVDRHPSFVLWPGIGFGKCYSCGVCGDFETLFSGLDIPKDLELLSLKALLEQRENETLCQLDDEVLTCFAPLTESAMEYIQSRGFNRECVDIFSLLFDSRREAIVFPVWLHNGKQLVGAVGRSIKEKRHHNYFNFPTGKTLGGLHRLSGNKKIAIVEGFTDLLNCYQWADELGFDVVCTWTANLTRDQAILLADTGKRVHCWFDQDDAGKKGFRAVQKQLEDSDYGLTRAEWSDPKLDLGNMSRDTFFSIFRGKK